MRATLYAVRGAMRSLGAWIADRRMARRMNQRARDDRMAAGLARWWASDEP